MLADSKIQTVGSPRSDQEVRDTPGRAIDVPPCGQTRHGGGLGGGVSQLTDLSADVLKGGRADQGEAYQEHILGENQRDGWLKAKTAERFKFLWPQ